MPVTLSSDVPTPAIRRPIEERKSARSSISGSHAAFSMTVYPSAVAAAMRMFPVAPTLEISKESVAPLSLSQRATM